VDIREEDVVKLAQQGNSLMEEYLIQKYKSVVKMRANSYYMAGADRDDIVQEGMIGIFKAIRDYDEEKGASFSTFVEMCINRQILTAIKRAGRLKHSPLNTSISLSRPIGGDDNAETLGETLSSGTGSDPETMMLIREELDFIKKYGEDLFSPMEWKVWTLHMRGKSYIEIGAIMDKKPKVIDNAIQRAKKKLEIWLARS